MTSATARGHVTGQEWRVTPQDDGTYTLTRPGETEPWLRCHPDKDFAVAIEGTKSELYDLEFWYESWPRRMSTLVEAARISEQSKDRRKLVDDGDFTDTVCNSCGKNPTRYERWGATHASDDVGRRYPRANTCYGTWIPAKKNPAR